MVIFEVNNVYSVDPNSATAEENPTCKVEPSDPTMAAEDYDWPFWTTGLDKYALAVFATVIGEKGAADYGYLVTQAGGSQAQLATPEMIELDDDLLTAELAKRIATLSDIGVAQFGIEGIIMAAQLRYPGIRGFSAK